MALPYYSTWMATDMSAEEGRNAVRCIPHSRIPLLDAYAARRLTSPPGEVCACGHVSVYLELGWLAQLTDWVYQGMFQLWSVAVKQSSNSGTIPELSHGKNKSL